MRRKICLCLEYILVALRLTTGAGFNPLIPLVHALPVGGAAMMLGVLLQRVWPQNRFSAVLIAPLLTLTSFFFDRAYTGTLLQNPLNAKPTETIVSYTYKTSFLNAKMSLGAAVELLQSAANLIPALVGALMIGVSRGCLAACFCVYCQQRHFRVSSVSVFHLSFRR